MRGGSVGRLVRELQATNMLLVNKWLYVIFGRYGGDLLLFRATRYFPLLRILSPLPFSLSHLADISRYRIARPV